MYGEAGLKSVCTFAYGHTLTYLLQVTQVKGSLFLCP